MTKTESQSTVVLTVDDARLAARSVAVRWHRAREGMQKTGTPPADVAEGVTAQPAGYTITYNFLTDRPSGVGRDRATGIVMQGSKAWPSDGRRARTAAGHDVVNAESRAGTTVRRAVACARGSRGVTSVEAQLMANCPVIYYEHTKYDACPPVRRLLRWAVATLAAGALWVSGVCGPRDEVASVTAQFMGNCRVIQYDDTEYDTCPPVRRLLRRVSGQPRWSHAVEQRRG